jgi:hypothetical protein
MRSTYCPYNKLVLRRLTGPGQYVSIRYTDRLDVAGAVWSVGRKGDSYDNAAVESLIGLYKTELIRRRGPWRGFDDLELATPGYVDWFNHRRLHSHCGDVPPVEFETNHYRQIADLTEDQPAEPSLHEAGVGHRRLWWWGRPRRGWSGRQTVAPSEARQRFPADTWWAVPATADRLALDKPPRPACTTGMGTCMGCPPSTGHPERAVPPQEAQDGHAAQQLGAGTAGRRGAGQMRKRRRRTDATVAVSRPGGRRRGPGAGGR